VKLARNLTSMAAAALAVACSIACAGSAPVILPRRPPLPDETAIREAELLCAPPEDAESLEGCRPTRIKVEICESSEEAGCDVRRGLADLLSGLDAYDDYVAELRGEKVLPEPEPAPEETP